jgi:replicative DNA helicase
MFNENLLANIEAEEEILGGIILDPQAIAKVIDRLPVEAFFVSTHQKIYQAAQILHNQGKPTDLMSISTYLADRGILEKIGGLTTLARFFNRTVSAVNIDRYAALVMDKYLRRKLIETGHSIVDLGYDTSRELDVIFDQSEQQIFKVSNQRLVSDTEHNASVAAVAYNQLEENTPIYPTGLYDLDELMVGFEPGTLTLVAGRPSM